MQSVYKINNLVHRWNHNSLWLINKHNLNKNNTYLLLLFYQYAFLRRMIGDKTRILISYLEENNNLSVVIASTNEDENTIRLKRLPFSFEIYKELNNAYDGNGAILINEEVVEVFSRIYSKYIN